MVIWSFYWFIYLIFKLLSNLKIMKNRFNVINVLFGIILEAKVSGHHDRDCMVHCSWNYIFCFLVTFFSLKHIWSSANDYKDNMLLTGPCIAYLIITPKNWQKRTKASSLYIHQLFYCKLLLSSQLAQDRISWSQLAYVVVFFLCLIFEVKGSCLFYWYYWKVILYIYIYTGSICTVLVWSTFVDYKKNLLLIFL